MTTVASTVAWIATAAGVAGLIVGLVALWGVFLRFRPELRARIDERREAIRLDARNRGRATGSISAVAVVDDDMTEIPAECAGLPDGTFRATDLPAHAAKWLVLRSSEANGPFPAGCRLLVKAGRSQRRLVVPKTAQGVSYYSVESQW